jgi:hypothetical protein
VVGGGGRKAANLASKNREKGKKIGKRKGAKSKERGGARVCERVSKGDPLLPISDEELRSGVVELAVNSVKEEKKEDSTAVTLTHESELNEDQEKKSKPGIDKMNENLMKDERNEGNSINDDGKARDRVVERPQRRFTWSALKLSVKEKCAVEENNEKLGGAEIAGKGPQRGDWHSVAAK